MGKINLLKKIVGLLFCNPRSSSVDSRGVKERAGFTLIEVVVAMGIFFIVLIALLGSYYSYYRNVQLQRYKTIGENLAQLQVEDIQNLAVSVIDNMIHDPTNSGYLPNYPSKPASPPPSGNKYYNNYDGAAYGDVYDSIQYDDSLHQYFPQDASFQIEHLKNICSKTDGTLPSDLLLPSSIDVERVPTTGTFIDYTLILHKEVSPKYKKRVVIIDKTPGLLDEKNKIFSIEVTVFWDVGGTEKSITITGEKSYARSST